MKIYWDHFGFREKNSGIGVYAEVMRKTFNSMGFTPILVDFSEASTILPAPVVSKKPVWLEWLAKCWVPKQFASDSEAVFHGLGNFDIPLVNAAKYPNLKFFLTIHDIIPLLHPRWSALKLQMSCLMPKRVERADGIVCVSEWTKKTILETFPSKTIDQKIIVISHGVDRDEIVKRRTDPQRDEGRILMVSRYEDYKGFEVLFQLLEREDPTQYFTIVTDAKGVARVSGFLRLKPKYLSRILVRSGLSRGELLNLYDAHDVLIQPSWYEGYGFPIQEAILRGCRCVYRQGSAMDDFGIGPGLVGMPRNAKISDWADVLKDLIATRDDDTINQQLFEKALTFPSWQETCYKLFNFYTLQNRQSGLQLEK